MGAQVINFEDIYKVRVKENNFYVPKKEAHGALLLIKSLIEAERIKDRYNAIIESSLTKHPKEFYEILHKIIGEELADNLFSSLKNDGLKSYINNKQLSRIWRRTLMRRPLKTIAGGFAVLWNSIGQKIVRKKGSFSCFLGPDGVGKTTVITLLEQRTAEVFFHEKKEVKVIHLRPGYLPNLGRIASKATRERKHIDKGDKQEIKASGILISFIRMMYYWCDYIIGYYILVRRSCAKGFHIIFDRYFYDFILDQGRARIDLPMAIRRAFLRLTPEPNIIFLLTCQAELIYERKQELSILEIRDYIDKYENFGRGNMRFIYME